MNDSIFESAGRLFFTRDRIRSLEKEISTAGVNMPADSFAGYVALNVIVLTIFLTLLILFFPATNELLTSMAAEYGNIPFVLIALLVLIVATASSAISFDEPCSRPISS